MEFTTKKKNLAKLTCDIHQSTSSVRPNSTATADLNGNDLGGEKSKERESDQKKKGRGEDSGKEKRRKKEEEVTKDKEEAEISEKERRKKQKREEGKVIKEERENE